MNRLANLVTIFIFFMWLFSLPSLCFAAGFGNMSSAVTPKYYLYNGAAASLGGAAAGETSQLVAANMIPYQQSSDLGHWYDKAQTDLAEGIEFRDTYLSTARIFANNSSARRQGLYNPKTYYETAEFQDRLRTITQNLISARNAFAFDFSIGYPGDRFGVPPPDPGEPTPLTMLLDTIRTLANIYLMIADDYLVSATEFRFSAETLGLDQKLSEQIGKLQTAQGYYQQAIGAFTYGFSPAVGANIYVSDQFTYAEYGLFNLTVERLSLCLREISSKQLVRQMAPDSSQNWSDARSTALAAIKEVNTTAYLLSAATASRQGDSFGSDGGDTLTTAIDAVRKQGNIYNNNLNPLGYDNRYIPMNDYTDLYTLANGWLVYAKEAKNDLDAETREFDADQEALKREIDALNSQYITSLSSFTGCSYPNPDDPGEVDTFLTCTGQAGGDLYDCRLALGATAFESCVADKATKGTLAMKFRNIMEAETRLEQARLNRQNILERINNENERTGKLIEIKRTELNVNTFKLDYYYNLLKKACTETSSESEGWSKTKEPGESWSKKNKKKDSSTTVTCTVRDDSLRIDTERNKDQLAMTAKFEIQQINLESGYRIKDLLLEEAESEIQYQLAAQQKNSAIEDFENCYQEKETQWYLYNQRRNQPTSYDPETFTKNRILKSQAAIALSEALNYTSHYAYLAAKALEYKYLKPIVDEPVAGGRVRLTDLFKAQTPADQEEFLLKLNALNTQNCPWGTFDPQYNTISLAYHILGLTDGYLDPDGDGFTADGKSVYQTRKEQVQSYIAQHLQLDGSLKFSFGLSEENSYLGSSGLYNVKIWNGTVSSPCDQLVSEVKGVSVALQTSQTSSIRPKVHLKQSGHSSLRNELGEIVEYIPVSQYHLLFEGQGDSIPAKEAEIIASVNVDPRSQQGTGTWTGAFKGRGLTSSSWEMTIFDWNSLYPKTDFSKISDIWFNIDTIGECCY